MCTSKALSQVINIQRVRSGCQLLNIDTMTSIQNNPICFLKLSRLCSLNIRLEIVFYPVNAAGNPEVSVMTVTNKQLPEPEFKKKKPKTNQPKTETCSLSHKIPPTVYEERVLLQPDQVLEVGNSLARTAGTGVYGHASLLAPTGHTGSRNPVPPAALGLTQHLPPQHHHV